MTESSPAQFSKDGELFQCHLNLLDGKSIIISMRDDGFTHVTKLGHAFNRQPSDWKRLSESKALIDRLESERGIPRSQLIQVRKGNSSKYSQGTWMHPDLALDFAQWCSPSLKLQILRYYRELILTGSASLNNPKSDQELKQSFENVTNEIPEEAQRYHKTHEGQFKKFLDENGEIYTFNRISADDPSICGKYRPDFLFQLASHCIIIEVDEHEHSHEDAACEMVRMFKMTHGIGLHTIFLRYNPDAEKDCKKEVLKRLRYYKALSIDKIEELPLLTIEYFGYSTKRIEELTKYQQEELSMDPTAMIRSLKQSCEKKEEELIRIKAMYEEELRRTKQQLENSKNININSTIKEYNQIENKETNQKSNESESDLESEESEKDYDTDEEFSDTELKTGICPICKRQGIHKQLSNKGKLVRHINTVHKKNDKSQCDQCNRTFSTKDNLNIHIRGVHNKETGIECPQCNKVISCAGNLRKHIDTVHTKALQVECHICQKVLGNKTALKTHIASVHEKSISFSCKYCGQIYRSKNGLEIHVLKKH